jgi:uncharacterized RDD family membrane protein YckC
MNQILDAPVSTDRKFEYAGFWIRVVAYFIDGFILSIVWYALLFAVIGSEWEAMQGGEIPASLLALYPVGFLGSAAYFILMESSAKQATLGKMAVGIKVGDERGQRIAGLTATGRYFGKIISGIILCVGYLMVAFDSKKQGLHDRLARTTVYYG